MSKVVKSPTRVQQGSAKVPEELTASINSAIWDTPSKHPKRVDKIYNHVGHDIHMRPIAVTITSAQLNCHAMDFDTILAQHKTAIEGAKKNGSKICLFPELSLCGYGCEDHFYESDTEMHSWCSLKDLLKYTDDILVDVGVPVTHRGCLYNCRVLIMDGEILGVRPKCFMAQEGLYRELRYFTPWSRNLPMDLISIDGEQYPFGMFYLKFADCSFGVEICEEMWTPTPVHTDLFLCGVDIVANSSGSFHNVGKINTRRNHVLQSTIKTGGVYVYTNFSGNDGGKTCMDGASCITANGTMLKEASFVTITTDVELIHSTIDIQYIRNTMVTKNSSGFSSQEQFKKNGMFPCIDMSHKCIINPMDSKIVSDWPQAPKKYWGTQVKEVEVPKVSESYESLKAASLWIYDYLRRCKGGARGFYIPLSGGADSTSTVALVYFMCTEIVARIREKNEDVIRDICMILGERRTFVEALTVPLLMKKICYTAYLGSANSSDKTRKMAAKVAETLGSHHIGIDIQGIVETFVNTLQTNLDVELKYSSQGGSARHDVVLQNLQARSRMVLSYALAKLANNGEDDPTSYLIVLSTGNASETLTGYFTKYDCSSGDLSPLGSLSKRNIFELLQEFYQITGFEIIKEVAATPPTAELRPLVNGMCSQTDEEDMGITYNDISLFSYMRSIQRCGPVQMYLRSVPLMPLLTRKEIAQKVKIFFSKYGNNRHKTATLTPTYQCAATCPDDSRNDHRMILYPGFARQFRVIDAMVHRETQQEK